MGYSNKHSQSHYIQIDSRKYRRQRIFVQVIQKDGWITHYFNVDDNEYTAAKPRANTMTSSLSLLNRKRLTAHILHSTKRQVN